MAAARNRARPCRRRERGRGRPGYSGSSRGNCRVAPRGQSRRGSVESPRLLDLVQIKRRHGTPRDRQEQAEETLDAMHGDVGRTIPRGAGHEIPTLAELLVSNSDAGHGEANANAARGGHHGRPPRATKGTTTIQAKKAARSPPSLGSKNSHRTPSRSPGESERENKKKSDTKTKDVREREETSAHAGGGAGRDRRG
jgi:hypothetical protein